MNSGYTYQVEHFCNVIQEMEPLLELHWKEIARHQEDVPLDVDKERYQELQEKRILHISTVRYLGELVGYMANIVAPSIHYASTLVATNDVLFVHPDRRGAGVFKELAAFAEGELLGMGVKVLYIHVKLAHDFGPLLTGIGFLPIEMNYEKVLG